MLLDFLAVQLNGPKADGKHIVINWNFTDSQKSFVLTLEHSVLTYTANKRVANADVSLTSTRDALNKIALRRVTISDAIQSGQIKAIGEATKAFELFSILETFNPNFEIVEPKKAFN